MIHKELKQELEVGASADEIWGVYSSPDLHRHLIMELLPGAFEKHEVLIGDGGVGTITFSKFGQGIVPRWYIEKFVTVDNKKRLMEVEMIEGGYLDMGCTFYMDTIHILEKGPDSSVILSKVTYQVPNEEIDKKVAPYISTASLASLATAIANYVLNKNKNLLHELQIAASAKDDQYWDVNSTSFDLPKLILKALLSVFKGIKIVNGNNGLGANVQITIPPGLTCPLPVTNKEKLIGNWCGQKSLKNWCLYLISVVSLVIMIFLSSRLITYKY